MKYYLIAGEASGDLHGANLMKALKERDADAEFRFLGGDLMLGQGGQLVKHYREMAYMGIVEVIAHLPAILRNMKQTKADLLQWQPDVLILIDFPGFNLKIAEFAKQHHIQTDFYISPKVWAWNQKRVFKIKRVVDHLFCILPFEVNFYKQWDMKVDYVGNPLLDAIVDFQPDADFLKKHSLTGKKLVALLPGSRKQEISKLLPVMEEVAGRFTDYQFVIAGAPAFEAEYYYQYLKNTNLPVLFGATYDLLTHAEAAIVASGTATLETALFRTPQVVVYKTSAVTAGLARLVLKIKYISLVNLIMDQLLVRELIQQDCNAEKVADELNNLLNNAQYRHQMLSNYTRLQQVMGEAGASARTADLIIEYAKGKKQIAR
ncbi:lipid-A-disaccharide synthase [Mucilaginibacter koreensis]